MEICCNHFLTGNRIEYQSFVNDHPKLGAQQGLIPVIIKIIFFTMDIESRPMEELDRHCPLSCLKCVCSEMDN